MDSAPMRRAPFYLQPAHLLLTLNAQTLIENFSLHSFFI